MNKIKKLNQLKNNLKKMKSVLVAFSGGVDSAFLLKTAKDALGASVTAVTAASITYPESEITSAEKIAKKLNVRHIVIKTNEFKNPKFVKNPLDRCYWCKKGLFSKLNKIAKANKISYVLDGTNYDDIKDFRPGTKAAKEFSVKSPLKDAGLTKDDIRFFSKKMRLPTWDKPPLACYASRFPYGTFITEKKLAVVDSVENVIRNAGIKQVRVRMHGDIARIEVLPRDICKIASPRLREKIVSALKKAGIRFVSADLEGYRTGSLNPVNSY